MVKVSHETPLCLLEDSRLFNDYDYCLPHLLDQEPGYQEYFRKARSSKVAILSWTIHLHELGHAYDDWIVSYTGYSVLYARMNLSYLMFGKIEINQ
jgi:hypothetical protein